MNTQLLLKYIEGDATDHEKAEITNWLDSDPENMREFLAIRKLNDISIWQESHDVQQVQKSDTKIIRWSWTRITAEALKIAAVLLVAVVGTRYVYQKPIRIDPVVMQTLHVPAGQRAELTLTDGTKVWLNAKTTLTFPNQFSDQIREVQLDGEGYFDVTSNKSRPFIVKTRKYDVKVWGTEFNLMAYSGKGIFETSLLEGSVEVLKTGSAQGVLIQPEQRIFEENNQLVIAPIIHANHFLWKEGIISFDNESFPEMVRKLELYFDLMIEVKNDKILKYRCTGKFRTKDGVEHILKVLQLSNKFSFEIDEKQNVITIE
ncbi:MAG: DUF4974 domain-containing protein [Mariniphaga sp.]|nr:DUF4974 domain-containing protein [Mariniphaga sp.]